MEGRGGKSKRRANELGMTYGTSLAWVRLDGGRVSEAHGVVGRGILG